MATEGDSPNRYAEALRRSGLTIYDPIDVGDPDLWIPAPELEDLLNAGLAGISLVGLPLRTRSKVVKEHVCRTLSYPVPSSFKKTQPRFPGQFFDTYVQKSNNLQIWNEELAPTRRYVIIRVSEDDVITKVKVVTGDSLVLLDTTGTLTQKYQARLIPGAAKSRANRGRRYVPSSAFCSAGRESELNRKPDQPSSASTIAPDQGNFRAAENTRWGGLCRHRL